MSEKKEKLTKMMIDALELGEDKLADIIMSKGADKDIAFIWYAKNYNIVRIRRLKDKVNVNRLDSNECAAADYACIGGSAEFCRELFSIDGIRVNTRELLIACENNNIEAFREVMKFPIDVNLVMHGTVAFYGGGFTKKSSLILAVEARNLEMVQAIRPRANKNLVNYAPGTSNIFGMPTSREDTALHLACYNADYEIVRELKKYEGFDVNVLECLNNSALFSALGGMEDALYQLNTKKLRNIKRFLMRGFLYYERLEKRAN